MSCLLCKKPSIGDLCNKHSEIFIYDKENELFRKKKRLTKGARGRDNRIKYHNTERKLAEILRIIFGRKKVITSVHPKWAVSPKGALLEYDIAVPSKKLLFEYNGKQHYIYPNFFHKTKVGFTQQLIRDKSKKFIAKERGWSLIVIKYDFIMTYANVYELLIDNGIVE